MNYPKKYNLRGVSASKSDVHKAIKSLDKGLFPLAFCKIMPDIVAKHSDYVNIMHADTAGTKTSLAYIYWKETGDLSVWKGIAQDAIVMNVDDMACVGVVDEILLSSTIGRNKNVISGEVISAIISGAKEFIEMLKPHGVNIYMSGGETADVGDIVRTIDVGYTTFARSHKKNLVVNDIKDGNVIVGLAGYGQANYETHYNSGIGSNGLTSARHDVFNKRYYSLYPESFDHNIPKELIYSGQRSLTDKVEINGEKINLGKLVLSPTRTFLPPLKKILDAHKSKISGIIHNTGGGHTKVKKFAPNKRIVKNNLLPIPTLFEIIKDESATDLSEMFQVFNMGTRLEIYTDSETAKDIIDISQSFNIDAQIIGYVENANQAEVRVIHNGNEYVY